LEEIEPADPTSVRRSDPALSASSADSGLHKLLDAARDPDRRTEVGAPPLTGGAPKVEASITGGKSVSTFTGIEGGGGGVARWVAIAVVIAVVGGFGVWKLTRPKDATVAVPSSDGSIEAKGELDLDSRPSGAKGTLTGPDGKSTPFGPTPVRVRVT